MFYKTSFFALLFIFILSFIPSLIFSQDSLITKDNYTGMLTDDNSWVNPPAPASPANIDIVIYGNITHIGDFTFNQNLSIHDTLIIFGDLTLGNLSNLKIYEGGILIVYGNYESKNKVEVSTGGYIVVTGSFVQLGSEIFGDFVIEDSGKVFLLGPTDIKDEGLMCDTICPYGGLDELQQDPLWSFFLSDIYYITPPGPLQFCEGDTVILHAPESTWFQWYKDGVIIEGADSSSYPVYQTGSYHVRIKVTETWVDTLSLFPVIVTVYPLPGQPVITPNGPTAFCQGGSVELSVPASASYLWSTTETTQSITVTEAGSYTIQVTDANGCASPLSDPAVVTVYSLPEKPVITPTGPTAFCQGGSVELSVPASASYLWSTTETTQSITVSAAGSYTVQVTDANGCASPLSDPVTVTVYSLPGKPVITPSGPTAFCQGGSVELSVPASSSYLWSTTETTQSITVATAGSYTVQVTDANGCTSPLSDPVTITVYSLPGKPVITPSGPTAFCQGGSVELSVPASSSYLWSTTETTQSITVATAGSYTVQVTDVNGCTSPLSDPVTVTVYSLPGKPVITPSGPTAFCQGGSVELSVPASASYLWSTTETTQSITVSEAGNYTVQVTDANGCASPLSDTVKVTVYPLPEKPVITPSGPTAFCQGGSVELSVPASDSYLWSTTETTQSITVSTTGSYTVQVTDANECASPLSDPAVVTVYSLPEKPVITPSGATAFCQGGSVELSVPASASYLWSTTETTQSITVSTTGSYTVQLTDANGCASPLSDTVKVTVYPLPEKPVITPSGATAFCQGGSVELSVPASASYLWSTTETTQSITVSTTGSYTVQLTDANECASPLSDTVKVTVYPLPERPVITPSGATAFCQGGSVELSVPASASYLWSTTETTQSITVTTAGNYTVQVTDANGCVSPQSDPVTVTVTVYSLPEKPFITPSGPTAFCQGGSVELSVPASSSYLWSTTETTQSITVSAAGSYTVQVTDTNGCTSPLSDPVTVTVYSLPEKPVIMPSGPTAFCQGESVELSVPVSSSYLWSTIETTQSITVSAAGSYTVQVTDANGCKSPLSDPAVVTVYSLPEKPVITPSGPTAFCQGGSVELSVPASSSYLWSTTETTQIITVTSAGSYTIQVTDANGCTSPLSDPAVVTMYSLPGKPVITPSGATTFCQGGSVELSVPASSSYLWSTTETTQSITVTSAGSYTVQVTDDNGCTSPLSDPAVVTVYSLPEKPVITPSGPTAFCQGGSVELSVPASTSYLWSTTETTQSITATATGNYTAQLTDANGCASPLSDPVTVTVYPLPEKPVITPSGTITIYIGETATLVSSLAYSYLWSPGGETTQSIITQNPGDYSVIVTDIHGCSSEASDPVTVISENKLPKPVITINGSVNLCDGESAELISSEAYSYEWSNGETTRNIIVTEVGDYSLVVRNISGIESAPSEIISIVVNPNPQVSLSKTDVTCFGGNDGSANAFVAGGQSPYNFKWSNNLTTDLITNIPSGSYSVTVTDNNGCTGTSEVTIDQPAQIIISCEQTDAYCPDSHDGSLSLSVSGGVGGFEYDWSTGDAGPTISELSPGDYQVMVSDANNCQVDAEYEIQFINEACFLIPDIITPNGDGKNDDWNLDGIEFYPDVTVEIYNRWGKRVFYSKAYETRWDGTFQGKELPMESYHYIINLHNGSDPVMGNVTIVR